MTRHVEDNWVVLEPSGDLREGEACDALERELDAYAGRRVLVDLHATGRLTARALGVLARAQKLTSTRGGVVAVRGADEIQRWLLDITGLSEALPVVEDAGAEAARKPQDQAAA